MQDLPERNSAEDEGAEEAPEGGRSVEVMWLRQRTGEGREGEKEGQRIRGPLSLALRPSLRGERGRAAWLCSQPGDTRSLSASSGLEPEPGKPAHRRKERACKREQAMCTERD